MKATEIQRLVDELTRWEKDMRPLRDEWDLMWRAWRVTPPTPAGEIPRTGETVNPYMAQVSVPYRLHAVETLIPRVLGDDPKIRYRARDHDEDNGAAAILSLVVQNQLEDCCFDLTSRDVVRQAMVTGYSPAKIGWRRGMKPRTETITTRHDAPNLPGQPSFQVESERTDMQVSFNEPFVEYVDCYDFVYPLSAATIQSAPAVWQRRWVSLDYLKMMEKAGRYGAKVGGEAVSKVGIYDQHEYANSRRDRLATQGLHPQTPEAEDSDAVVELWERWSGDRLIALANPRADHVLLRDVPHIFRHGRKPFADFTPIPVPGQIHGIGIVRVIYDLNEHLDTHRRQQLDAMAYILNPMWEATENTDTTTLRAGPGEVVIVEELGAGIRPLIAPEVNFAAAASMEQRIYEDMQRTSGALTYLDGTGAGETATGVATISQEGNKRITEMVKVFNKRFMRELAIQLMELNLQFVDESIAVDLSRDQQSLDAWNAYLEGKTLPAGLLGGLRQKITGQDAYQPVSGIAEVQPDQIRPNGRLDPIPEVGVDIQQNLVQRRSDAVQMSQVIEPLLASPQAGIDVKHLADYLMERMGVEKVDRNRILSADPSENLAYQQATQSNGSSGPSGDTLPTGNVVGAPGVAGPSGPPQVAQ